MAIPEAIEKWMLAHVDGLMTAVATTAMAVFMWFERRRQKMREQPFVECKIEHGQPPGWVRLDFVIRNFNPHAVHVLELRVKRPRSSALFDEREAYKNVVGIQPDRPEFIASNARPKLSAGINATLDPVNTSVRYPGPMGATVTPGDAIHRRFFYSPGPGRRKAVLKMSLICELRSRDVRRSEIAITRSITL